MMRCGVGAAIRDRRRNLMIMPEGREDAGLIHPHGHDRFPDIDRLLFGARCPQRHNYCRPEPNLSAGLPGPLCHIQIHGNLGAMAHSDKFHNY